MFLMVFMGVFGTMSVEYEILLSVFVLCELSGMFIYVIEVLYHWIHLIYIYQYTI